MIFEASVLPDPDSPGKYRNKWIFDVMLNNNHKPDITIQLFKERCFRVRYAASASANICAGRSNISRPL